MSMHFTFRCKMPPSTNNCYVNIPKRGRVLTKEARTFKDATGWVIYKERKAQDWDYQPGTRLALTVEYYFARAGKRDISNRIKLVEDALAEALGFDDSVIDRIELRRASTRAKQEFCQVWLEPI